jgi:hypothetical protein
VSECQTHRCRRPLCLAARPVLPHRDGNGRAAKKRRAGLCHLKSTFPEHIASLADLARVGVSIHIRFLPWESLIGDVRSWSLIQTFAPPFVRSRSSREVSGMRIDAVLDERLRGGASLALYVLRSPPRRPLW